MEQVNKETIRQNIIAERLRNHLTCSICLEVFTTPKTLPCLHSFCYSCLENHISKGIEAGPDDRLSFDCPLCRREICSVEGSESSKWAEHFPTNHFIMSMIDDGLQTLGVSNIVEKPKKEMQCIPCILDGKHSKPFAFCTMCIEYLCKDCYNDHRRFKSTRNHSVLKDESLPTDISAFQKMKGYGFCDIHDKELEFKCFSHDKFVCSICVASEHRKCGHLVHVDNIDSENEQTFQENVLKLSVLKSYV